MKILIADDDPVSRTLLTGIIQSGGGGYNIVAAVDGAQAWADLQSNPDVKLAILDLSMPGMSGLELIDRMRGDPRFASTPVIICTGTADRATVTAAIKRGITQFLVKPLNRTTVLEKVWSICKPTPVVAPVLENTNEVRQRFEIDRETYREMLEQALRLADLWASNAQRANDFPRVRTAALLAPTMRQLFSSLGAVSVAAKLQEAEESLAVYRRKPLQAEEANCYRTSRTAGEKVQRELDRLRQELHNA